MDACLPVGCQVTDVHDRNFHGFQGCLLLGYQTVPGGCDTLCVELV